MFGCKVVKGYGAILGRAFESAFSKVDLPAYIRGWRKERWRKERKGKEGREGDEEEVRS